MKFNFCIGIGIILLLVMLSFITSKTYKTEITTKTHISKSNNNKLNTFNKTTSKITKTISNSNNNKNTLKFKSKSTKSTKSKNPEIFAETYSFDDSDSGSIAISYGGAKYPNGKNQNLDMLDIAIPQIVHKLDDVIPRPRPGPLETIDEIPTVHIYYDGEVKLNKVDIKCRIYLIKSDCIHNSECGWCGSNNNCILGNSFGPQQPCVKASFIYSPPHPNFNPATSVINEKVAGSSMHLISHNTR